MSNITKKKSNECIILYLFQVHSKYFSENFLNLEAIDAEETIELLIPFLVNNFRILPYQQLMLLNTIDLSRITLVVLFVILNGHHVSVHLLFSNVAILATKSASFSCTKRN